MPEVLKWIVRRLHWRQLQPTPEDGPRYVRLPGATTVAEFDDRHDAESDRWAREQALRERINPFRCGFDLADCTHIPDFAFKDFLMDDSIRPAKYDSTAQIRWDKWWDTHSPGWNAVRKARIWEALDKVRFFEVASRDVDRQVFIAVEAVEFLQRVSVWTPGRFGPNVSDVGTEGGRPVRAFRSRVDADAYLELVAEVNDRQERTQPDTDPFTHPDTRVQVPADRVHDVTLDDELSADLRTVFVVCRAGLALNRDRHRVANWTIDDYRSGSTEWDDQYIPLGEPPRRPVYSPRLVPETAFTTREAAEDDARERMRATRRLLNPTLIYDFARDDPGGPEPSALWRSANVNNAPDAAFEAAWACCTRVSLYHVVEIELED